MEVSLGEIAKLVHGTISGSDDVVVRGVASFEAAGPGDITFAVSKEYIRRLNETNADVIIVPRSVSESQKILVRVDNPYLALAKVSTLFHGQREGQNTSEQGHLGGCGVRRDQCVVDGRSGTSKLVWRQRCCAASWSGRSWTCAQRSS